MSNQVGYAVGSELGSDVTGGSVWVEYRALISAIICDLVDNVNVIVFFVVHGNMSM